MTASLAINLLIVWKMKINHRTSIQSYKKPPYKVLTSWNHGFHKMSTCKTRAHFRRLKDQILTQCFWQLRPGNWPYSCRQLKNFFGTREFILSLKYSSLNVLTENNHSRSGKILYVEKNNLKLTKNRIFPPWRLKTSITQLLLPKLAKNIVRWCGLFIPPTFMIDTINYWTLLKNYTFFWTFIFAWIIFWEGLGRIFYELIMELLDHAQWAGIVRHQPNELVNQNGDIGEWKLRGIFLITI